MSSVAVLRQNSSSLFSGDSDYLLSSLLETQCRQRAAAKASYTGFGRSLQPYDFGGVSDSFNVSTSSASTKERSTTIRRVRSRNSSDRSDKQLWQVLEEGFDSGKSSGPLQQRKLSQKLQSKVDALLNLQQEGGKSSERRTARREQRTPRRRSNKKFSTLRQKSAQAQELTLHNVTQLRGYNSDTGGSEVQSFLSESSKRSFKSESSISMLYRSGFDGLEIEDHLPDFQALMPSIHRAVPL